MINDKKGLEGAVDEALNLLAEPPEPGTARGHRLDQLVEAVERAKPILDLPHDDPVQERLHALTQALDTFQRQRHEGEGKPGAQGEGAAFLFPG